MLPRIPIVCIAIVATLISASVCAQQPKLDIIQIMGQFVQANHAASKCSKPDQSTLSRFLWNFHFVTVRASEEMRRRKPEMTEQQVADKFKVASDAVAKQIDEVIRSNGCGDPRIQDLLKRFEMQANLKLL